MSYPNYKSRNPNHQKKGNNDGCKDIKDLSFKNEWITSGVDDDAIKFAESMGKCLGKTDVSSSQLRNIYGEIVRIKMKGYTNEKNAFILLKPKVAYNYGRLKKPGFKIFKYKFFDKAHDLVEDDNTFKNFVNLFEAILAYHKVYGKR